MAGGRDSASLGRENEGVSRDLDLVLAVFGGLELDLVDLTGDAVVISVEPDPDNSPMPFTLKPLVDVVDANASVHTTQMMDNNATATNPTGTVSR